jgi:protein-disulfide isomerase
LPEDKYFDFIDLLFRNQPKWDHEYGVQDVHAGLVLVGRMAGMSEAQVDKCMADTKEDDIINEVAKDGQAKYGITGTPTIVVDGVSAGSRFFSYDEVKTLIDTALAKKK